MRFSHGWSQASVPAGCQGDFAARINLPRLSDWGALTFNSPCRFNLFDERFLCIVHHTFLLEPGRWLLTGHLIEPGLDPLPFNGQGVVQWDSSFWFHAILRMVFAESDCDRQPLLLEYRGRIPSGSSSYSFGLQHGDLGRVEGEGWIAPETVIHRYWVLGDRQKRMGYESFFRIDDNHYCFSSGVMAGLKLMRNLEAKLERV